MGQNTDRLDRLKGNRSSFFAESMRGMQTASMKAAASAASSVTVDVRKAASITGFQGGQGLGDQIAERLTDIHRRLADFTEYQKQLGTLVARAHSELESTASGVDGLPAAGLTPAQQNTVNVAASTDSPVQVRPGVMVSSSEAQQYYLDQAIAAQEEQATQMAAALDARLQEIIDSMPVTDYDEPKPVDDPSDSDGPGGNTPVNYPGINGGGSGGSGDYDGPGVIGGGVDNGNNGGDGDGDDTKTDPPRVVDPPRVYPPVDPPVSPPVPETEWPDPNDNGGDDTPRIDGDTGGLTGGGGGGAGSPGGLTGTVSGGSGGGGAAGSVGGAGGIVGGAAAGLAGRLGGGGLMGGVGGVGGVGSTGAGAGASGVVAQSGAANGGRGGMVGGAAAGGGAGGGSDKRNRRRGQDLLAFEVEPDDDQIAPDLGAAGSAGRSASDGREELGW